MSTCQGSFERPNDRKDFEMLPACMPTETSLYRNIASKLHIRIQLRYQNHQRHPMSSLEMSCVKRPGVCLTEGLPKKWTKLKGKVCLTLQKRHMPWPHYFRHALCTDIIFSSKSKEMNCCKILKLNQQLNQLNQLNQVTNSVKSTMNFDESNRRIVETCRQIPLHAADLGPWAQFDLTERAWKSYTDTAQITEIALRLICHMLYKHIETWKIYTMLHAFTAGYVICFHLHGTFKHSLAQCRQTESNIKKLQVASLKSFSLIIWVHYPSPEWLLWCLTTSCSLCFRQSFTDINKCDYDGFNVWFVLGKSLEKKAEERVRH